MSHYYAKEMFNPVLVSPTFKIENSSLSKDVIEVHVISELLEELKNLRLEISIQRFDSVQYAHQQNLMIGNYFFLFSTLISYSVLPFKHLLRQIIFHYSQIHS